MQPQATSAQNFGGAILNVIIFVAVIGAMTFVLFFLFYFGCYRVIYTYMGFSMMSVFFLMTSLLLILLLQVGNVHVDAFSFCYIMWNFSILGTLATLFMPAPLLLKQGYMVWVGVIIAYIFTWIPDWTSWVLLVAMAIYDIAAVLIPGGPLNLLVELAIERNRELPALVYESRPAGGYRGAGNWDRHRERMEQQQQQQQQPPVERADDEDEEHAAVIQARPGPQPVAEGTINEAGPVAEGGVVDDAASSVAYKPVPSSDPQGLGSRIPSSSTSGVDLVAGLASSRVAPLPMQFPAPSRLNRTHETLPGTSPDSGAPVATSGQERDEEEARRDEEEGIEMPDGVKLGLGDFIFYSMLVGKAANYDMMTVYASFIGIIAGLGITLLCLAIYDRALPALPFSIALGVLFYFTTVIVLEPFIVPLSTHLTFF